MRFAKGFTLIEMLIAIALLAIIGAALVAFLPTIVTLNRRSSEDQSTTIAAKKFFEELRAELAADFEANLPSYPASCKPGEETTTNSKGEIYLRRISLTCGSDVFVAEFGRP